MRVLFDTNILIYREDTKAIPENVSALLKLLQENNYQIVIHPASVQDINRDKNGERKAILLSKLESYPRITSPPIPNDEFFNLLGNPSINSHTEIDLKLLYAIYRNAANIFITEDKGIHKFAARLDIDNKVFGVDKALAILEKQAIKMPEHFRIKIEQMHNIDYLDPFFDTLREDYGDPGFNKWFVDKSQDGRPCWVHLVDEKLNAILILKDENEVLLLRNARGLEKKRRLKLATLKVEQRWFRIGELFIKQAIKYCVQNNIDEAYLTHFVKENDELVKLIEKFGFEEIGERDFKNKEGAYEKVFFKKLRPDSASGIEPIEISRKYFPSFVDSARVDKFLIPIIPEYHNRLFQDYVTRQHLITDYTSDIPQGNTIRKAYVSRSPCKQLKTGDLVLFYRSHDQKAITSIGTVERVYYGLNDTDEIITVLGFNRSVYSEEEVRHMKLPVSVIIFRHHFNLEPRIHLQTLKEHKILSAAPYSISKLSEKQYRYIKNNGGIDGRFTFD